jgi:hypothetical protein
MISFMPARNWLALLLVLSASQALAQNDLQCPLPRLQELRPGDFVEEQAPVSKVQRVKAELEELARRYNTSVPTWEARADAVRRGILKGAGLDPLPVRQRMSTRTRNTIFRNGYTIDSMALEISPGYWLAGNLYRPLGCIGKVPAIAHPIGHFKKDGWLTRTQPEMQARAGHLAQMGAVVFTYDMVGWGETRQVPHSSERALALQLWNSIRVIDFLVSLPEVDASRIAMIGASSGGTQTILAAAVDPRIAVSVPVVKITALTAGGCTCETGMPVRAETGSNNAEIAALVAPKPLLIVTDGDDDTKHFPELELPYIEGIYRLYGAESHFRNVHLADEGHDFGINKRKAVYDFLAEHLGLDRIPLGTSPSKYPENVMIADSDSLQVWTQGFYGPMEGDFMVLLPKSPVPGWIYEEEQP